MSGPNPLPLCQSMHREVSRGQALLDQDRVVSSKGRAVSIGPEDQSQVSLPVSNLPSAES